ncbi:MAG: hypothetical protein ACRD4A_07820, partial [Candidatus Acidiferrales bacterium]
MHLFRDRHAAKISSVVVLLCAALMALPAVARAQSATRSAAKDLTVERIYSAPSLSGETLRGVAWASDGKHLGYFRPAGDGMDLMVIDAATGQNHILVSAKKLTALMPPPKRQVAQRTGFGRA